MVLRWLVAAVATGGFAQPAMAHEFVFGGRSIPHVHASPEFLLLAVLVAALAILRSK